MFDINTTEGRIMQLRALGYSQEEIANQLNLSQSAISQRLEVINQKAKCEGDPNKAFWTLLLGAGALYLLWKSTNNK